MCQRIDTAEEELELSRTILLALRQWESLMCVLLNENDITGMNRVERFCSDMRERLMELLVRG